MDDSAIYAQQSDDERDLRASAIREHESYNGWTNRETWNTHLWMTNDPGLYETARTIVRERFESDMDYPRVGAADALKDWWDEMFAPADASPLSDAWSYAVARTDWFEIVDAFTEGETWPADAAARGIEGAIR